MGKRTETESITVSKVGRSQ